MRRELQDSWDLDNPEFAGHELAPDLAWMLSSGAPSPEVLVEALIREHYASLYRMALEALTYPEEAQRIADETILAAAAQASRYSADQDVWAWLAEIAGQRLERRQEELARLECLNPQLAKAYLQRWPPLAVNAQILEQAVQRLGEKGSPGSSRMQLEGILVSAAGMVLALLLLWGAVSGLVMAPSRSSSPSREITIANLEAVIPATPAGTEKADPRAPAGRPVRQYSIRDLAFPDQPSLAEIDASYSATRLWALNLRALSRFSSHEDAWRRMLFSRYLWKTMWADVWIILYGPEGYSGPARSRRHQVWIDQTEEIVRWISGPLDGAPDRQEFLVGSTAEKQMGNLRDSDDFARLGSQIPWFYLDDREAVASPFLRSLYFLAHRDWPPTRERFQVSGEASWMGRPVVVVEQLDRRGHREARYWMDRQMGIAYREQYFSGGDSEHVALEVYVPNFEFDSAFPDGLLGEVSTDLPPAFFLNSTGEKELARPGRQDFFYSPDQAQPRRNSPIPPELNLGASVLTFLPPCASCAPDPPLLTSELPPLQVLADGYYLGDMPLGDPYTTLCKRSADGMQIAFAPQQRADYSSLNWFSLDDMRLRTDTFPGAAIVAFEFSPDDRRLALATIRNGGQSSEIFIVDTENGARTQLPLLEPVWGLAWKPDGSALAALEGPQLFISSDFLVQITLMDLEHGQLTSAQTPAEAGWGITQVTIPLKDWEARFRFPMGGLEACTSPRGN